MLDDIIGTSTTNTNAESYAKNSTLDLENSVSKQGLLSRAYSSIKRNLGTISKVALAAASGFLLYSAAPNMAEAAEQEEPKTKAEEPCEIGITNQDLDCSDDFKPDSQCSIFVNMCGRDLDFNYDTNLVKVVKIKDGINDVKVEKVFEYDLKPLYWGFGLQYFEVRAELRDEEGTLLDAIPRLHVKDKEFNRIHFEVSPIEEDSTEEEEDKGYDASKVTLNPKIAFNYVLWSDTNNATLSALPVMSSPGTGIVYSPTNISASLKLGGRYVNTDTWWAAVNAGFGFSNDFGASVMGGFQFTGDTVREIPFGFGGKVGVNTGQIYSHDVQNTVAALEIGVVFFGDELSNGPFEKPFDDIEYQISAGVFLSGFGGEDNQADTETYINASFETFFDFSKVQYGNLLGLMLDLHIRPYMNSNIRPGDNFSNASDFWVAAGPKFRLEIPQLNHSRLDIKPAYFAATDDFNKYIQGVFLTIIAEY